MGGCYAVYGFGMAQAVGAVGVGGGHYMYLLVVFGTVPPVSGWCGETGGATVLIFSSLWSGRIYTRSYPKLHPMTQQALDLHRLLFLLPTVLLRFSRL